MGKDWKYIAYLLLLAFLFAFIFLSKEKQYDWNVTLAHEDKNPYGTYALSELWPTAFSGHVEHIYKTFYEFKDSLKHNENVLILSTSFQPDKEDARAMLDYTNNGGIIFISSNYFTGLLADTLGVRTADYIFDGGNFSQNQNDSSFIQLVNPTLDTSRFFYFKSGNIHSYFTKADTTGKKKYKFANVKVITKNSNGKPTTLKIDHGKGYFIFSSTPLVFTNIYLLDRENSILISSLFSYLPDRKIYRSEYYQLGRMEAATPLRFILTNGPLRWSYYIAMISILLFIVFEAKRRQRPIPVIAPLANTSLEFVSTIGSLYFEQKDHKAIATKKILFFFESLREKFNFSLPLHVSGYVKSLAHKAGIDESMVQRLIGLINEINEKEKISESELIELNKAIQKFWKK